MSIKFMPLGQGLPLGAEGADWWPDRWWPLRDEDRIHFERHRSARFIVRRWIEDDDRFVHAKANQLDMVGATIVFRSGQRSIDWDVPPRDSLKGVVGVALWCLGRCPSLAADASEASGPAQRLDDPALEEALQLSVDMTYIDAPGTFWISDDLLIFRDFREEKVEPFWRTYLLARRDAIKRDFLGNERSRRRSLRLFPRVSSFGLFASERKTKR